jgi:phosphoglycerate kinase
MTQFRSIEEIPPEAERLLVRVDLNAPVDGDTVQSTKRFERHAETVRTLLDSEYAVALMAHQGRPGDDDFVSLAQHADILADLVEDPVDHVPDTYGEDALAAIEELAPGEALLLENTRMTDDELPEKAAEEHAESAFVRTLAPEFDAYVNDAFSAAHRAHASLVGFPVVMDAYAGPVMVAEYGNTTAIRDREFDGHVAMVLGGTKADDLVAVMEGVRDTVDTYLMGGVIAELFLRARGADVGYDVADTDLFDEQWAENEDVVRELAAEYGEDIRLPVDLARDENGRRVEDRADDIHKEAPYLDVGAETVAAYRPIIEDSAAVFVKGALGVFEDEEFSDGTVGVLSAIADTDCFSVVGGGDTARAIDMYGLSEADFSHVSIAGGAYVRALTGEELPAVAALGRN